MPVSMLLLVLSCTTGVDDSASSLDDSATPGTVELAGSCDLAERFGGLEVEVYESYTVAGGTVYEGVIPITVLESIGTSGDCVLLRKPNPFCDPPCAAAEVCDLHETCIAYPSTQDLGTVTISGLEVEVVMEPVPPGFTYFDTALPHPGVLPGSLVTLRTGGDVWPGVTLHGVGVHDLVPGEDEWVIAEGTALSVSWDAPTESVRSEVVLAVQVDQHGTTPATVVCAFEDTGAGEVPVDMVDALVQAGVTGFPNGTLERRTADRAALGEGCIDFTVSSPRFMSVDVEGFIPCTSNRDCPKGKTCNLEIQICE